ncbi:MAG: hypothetical protein Fur0041_12130 [Bacteroidia bacterium]
MLEGSHLKKLGREHKSVVQKDSDDKCLLSAENINISENKMLEASSALNSEYTYGLKRK